MNNAKFIHRTALLSGMALIALLICCVAFIGCPEVEEMTDEVMTPTGDQPPPPEEDKPAPPEEDQPPPPEEDQPPPPEEDQPPPP